MIGGTKPTSELVADIAETRDQMGNTIQQLHGLLNPEALKEEALKQFRDAKETIKAELQDELAEAKESIKAEYAETKHQLAAEVREGISHAKDSVREATLGKVETMLHNTQESMKATGRSVLTTAKENPIPTAMVGIGLVWLITSARSRASEQGYYGGTDVGGWKGPSRAAEGAANFARDTMEQGKRLAHGAAEQSKRLAHGAVDQGKRIGHAAEETYEANPLLVGAAVVAVGAAIGFAVPITKNETRWMGNAGDSVLEQAGALADQARGTLETAVSKRLENGQGGDGRRA